MIFVSPAEGTGTMGDWLFQELANCNFADIRLEKRFSKLMKRLLVITWFDEQNSVAILVEHETRHRATWSSGVASRGWQTSMSVSVWPDLWSSEIFTERLRFEPATSASWTKQTCRKISGIIGFPSRKLTKYDGIVHRLCHYACSLRYRKKAVKIINNAGDSKRCQIVFHVIDKM